jgi:hypothetical protein
MSEFLGKRDGWWHYVRRVPAVYAEHERGELPALRTLVGSRSPPSLRAFGHPTQPEIQE